MRLSVAQLQNQIDRRSILINIINMKNTDDGGFCTVDSSQACTRLGISRDTLYAYVSRGLVRTIAQPGDARKSLYDRRDIAALLERKSRGRSRRSVAESTINWGEPVLASSITRIADGTFFYRGKGAVDLSRSATLEETLELLANVRCKTAGNVQNREVISRRSTAFDRILTMLAAQATGVQGGDGRPRAGQIMRLTALNAAGGFANPVDPIHSLLGKAWSSDPAAPDLIRRALVLCADHELNASTYAARVAASAGASLPASLLAGLATLSGSAHGGLTVRCGRWMDAVEARGSGGESPLSANGKEPPGFGHPLYPDGDPRTAELLVHCPVSNRWRRIIDQVHDATGLRPALDFALAHLERELRLPTGAGFGIFAVGRTAGWVAHIFEQRKTGQLIRPRAQVDT